MRRVDESSCLQDGQGNRLPDKQQVIRWSAIVYAVFNFPREDVNHSLTNLARPGP